MSQLGNVQVWETEDAILVVFGTHKIGPAHEAAKKFYTENVGEVPEGLYEELSDAALRGDGWGHRWADPAVLNLDEQAWPESMVSAVPVKGWTPFLVVMW